MNGSARLASSRLGLEANSGRHSLLHHGRREPRRLVRARQGLLLYDELFARAIIAAGVRRQLPWRSVERGSTLNNSDSLPARRKSRENHPSSSRRSASRIGRVFIPSRIMLGADAAVHEHGPEKVERRFPRAEASSAPAAGASLRRARRRQARFVEIAYLRQGGASRRDSCEPWIELVKRRARRDGRPRNPMSPSPLDPIPAHATRSSSCRRCADSLLLLRKPGRPATRRRHSRRAERPDGSTRRWVNEGDALYPQVVPSASDSIAAKVVARQMRAAGGGGTHREGEPGVRRQPLEIIPNDSKRYLVRALLSEGSAVVLGIGNR